MTQAQVALATTSDDLQAKNDGLAQELQSVRTEHTALLRAHATLVQSHTKCAEQAESLPGRSWARGVIHRNGADEHHGATHELALGFERALSKVP
mgnify:CR=1 FL=1